MRTRLDDCHDRRQHGLHTPRWSQSKCSQADLMAYASSAFFKIGKKRKDIVQFLCTVFEAYFPGGEGFVYKKMRGTKS